MPNEMIRQQNMQTVLNQAMKLFVENGVENTSFEMIARESGLSLRSVQNYYHTKNDLIAAVLEFGLAIELREMKDFICTDTYRNKIGAEQILTIITVAYNKAVEKAAVISCATQMQHILSRASDNESKPLLAGNCQYIMEQIQKAFDKGLQDGSITRQMEASLFDAKSITLALYGIKEQIAFAMCDRELRNLFQPEIAAQKYIKQIELLLSAK
jgi:AcrR family transcriptional regulator